MDRDKLLEILKKGNLTLKDLEDIGGSTLSKPVRVSMVRQPNDWVEYITDRLYKRFYTDSEISEHRDFYAELLDIGQWNIKNVNNLFGLQAKRTAKQLKIEKTREEYWEEKETKFQAASDVLSGYHEISEAATKYKVNPRTLHRYVISMAQKGGLPVRGKKDLNEIPVQEKKAVAKLAWLELAKEKQEYYEEYVRGDTRYTRKHGNTKDKRTDNGQ